MLQRMASVPRYLVPLGSAERRGGGHKPPMVYRVKRVLELVRSGEAAS